jgi:DNA-binding SARP family transcriptional activator
VLHGPWPDGVTAYARADGTIVAAGPTEYAELVGRRLPVLDVVTATELLDLATHAGPHQPTVGSTGQHHRTGNHPVPEGGETRGQDDDLAGHATIEPVGGADGVAGRGRGRVTPWTLNMLGRPTLLARRPGRADGEDVTEDVTRVLSPRMLALLVFLALHPHGIRRDAAVAALWPDSGRERPGNNLSSLISRLRAVIRSTGPAYIFKEDGDGTDRVGRIVIVDGDRYQLDPDHMTVDYWAFLAATAAANTTPATGPAGGPERNLDEEDLAALHTAHNLYRGPLGDGLDDEWILSVREAARRSFLATIARLVRHYVPTKPTVALQLLETARNLEPTNQSIYRDIIALQLRTGDNDGAAATMRLLETQLADIEESPDNATVTLARNIHQTRH